MDGRGAGTLRPRFMLRAAGLPVESVHGLRSPAARRWADELLAEEERLTALGALLSEPLAALVGSAPDDRRRQLLAVRRQVFNNRLPQDPAAALALAEELGGPTGELLAHWLRARERLAGLQGAGDALLAGELADSRAQLRRLAGLAPLRLGLLLASPTLEAKLDAFVAAPAAAADKRTRRMERSLLSYLYRTACKTSPFSTLTTVAPGTFGPSAEGELQLGGEPAGHPRLNVVVLSRIAELIGADPGRRRDLPVALASGWILDEDRVRYVRRSVTAGDDSAAVSFDAAQDRLFFLRLSGVLEQVLGHLGSRPLIRHGELSALLRDGTDATTAEAEHYLTALLELGILQLPWLTTDVHSHDPLHSFQAALRSLDRPWADAVAARLDGPADCVARYPAADVPTRRALLAALRRDLLTVQAELGAGQPTLPQTLLYEDVAGPAVEADAAEWARLAGGPLGSLARILPVFDVALAQRLTLKGFFLVRYGQGGRCEDLLKLVHDFHEDIFNQYLQFTSQKPAAGQDHAHPAEKNWLGMPEITALDRARAELTRRMNELWASRAEDAEELELDDAALSAVASELSPLARGFEPYSHFLQLARRADDPLVVLNNSYGGLCFPFTRFTHCFDAGADDSPGGLSPDGLPAALREGLRELRPPGAVFAEVTAGAATTNLNLHTRLTDHEIVCPGETSTAPESGRIQLDDLYVEHDTAADRLVLRSRRLGREVVPLYLGYLVPMVLPEIPRTLLLFSPTSRVTPEAWRGVPAAPATDGVAHRPRLRHGSLVLHRRAWTAEPGSLPSADAAGSGTGTGTGTGTGNGDAERYLRWQRWRRRHGLPDQVFARVRAVPQDGGTGGWLGASKPQYVDFDSPLSLIALDALIAGRAVRVVFEEMLPGEDALHVRSAHGRHVAELAVETTPRAAAAASEQQGEQSLD